MSDACPNGHEYPADPKRDDMGHRRCVTCLRAKWRRQYRSRRNKLMPTINLPVPPSVNAMYRNVPKRGRVRTKAYLKWLANADQYYLAQKRQIEPITGPCELRIRLPKCRGDISNRIKACEDFLVSRGITGDDKHNRKVSVERDESLTCCVVEIRSAA